MTCAYWKSTRSRLLYAAISILAATGCSADAGVSPIDPGTAAAGSSGSSDDGGSAVGGSRSVRDASINLATTDAGPPPPPPPPPPDAEVVDVQLPQDIVTMRLDPENLVIVLKRGQGTTVSFRAFATMEATGQEVEITDRTIFYVPDSYMVGRFPDDGSNVFTTWLPASATDPPQRGGKVTIQAKAASNNKPVTTVTTTLTVTIIDSGQAAVASPAATPALPSDPGSNFTGSNSAALAPTLVYPNDSVLLPPNMEQLEVHYLPSKTATLYEISLISPFSEYRYYTRCYADPLKFLAGSCAYEIDADTVNIIAESNRGTAPVKLMVRGTDEKGGVGSSAGIKVQFAASRVDGAIYYWTTSDPPRIMRFDFSSQSALATAIKPSDLPSDTGVAGANTRCIGCHALSRDGRRMVASTGASWEGNLVYVNDMSKPKTAADWLTVDGRGVGVASQNKVMTVSFNPDGSQFVAVGPASDWTLGSTKLAFHDGVTGLRTTPFLDVGFTVAYPDWSPDGQTLAVAHVYGQNSSTIEFQEGGISVIRRSAAGWNAVEEVVVPHTVGKNRYTPNFVPDSSFLLYSEATRQSATADPTVTSYANPTDDKLVNGYSDPSATVWAVQPSANAKPVLLARSNAPGVADKLTLADGRSTIVTSRIANGMLMNTFPRSAPFEVQQGGDKLFWFTVASQRRAGLRLFKANNSVTGDEPTQELLWMFAVDADQVLAGQDGSYPGFFLPFQDMLTSNHMAYWTEKYISDTPPKEPPVTPLPPIPPPLTVEPPPPPPPSGPVQ